MQLRGVAAVNAEGQPVLAYIRLLPALGASFLACAQLKLS